MRGFTRRSVLASGVGVAVALAGCNDTQTGPSDGGAGTTESGNDDGSGGSSRSDGRSGGSDSTSDGSGNDGTRSSGGSLIDSDEKNTLIPEDAYEGWTLESSDDFRIEYEFIVRDGPAIDAILFEESELSHYEDGDRFEYVPSASALDSTGDSVTADLPAGSYVLAFDNTNAGEAQPPSNFSDDGIELEAEMEMYAL